MSSALSSTSSSAAVPSNTNVNFLTTGVKRFFTIFTQSNKQSDNNNQSQPHLSNSYENSTTIYNQQTKYKIPKVLHSITEAEADPSTSNTTYSNNGNNINTSNSSTPLFSSNLLSSSNIPGLQLFSNFISIDEEKELLQYINNETWDSNNGINRRTQQYGYEYPYNIKVNNVKQIKLTKSIPQVFEELVINKLINLNCIPNNCRPNQALVNEYKPGQGIAAHIDNKLFGMFIASLSLGSDCNMYLNDNRRTNNSSMNDGNICVILPRCSMLILSSVARYDYTHEIKKTKTDLINGVKKQRNTRISITLRRLTIETNTK